MNKRKVAWFLLPLILLPSLLAVLYLVFPFYALPLMNIVVKDYGIEINELRVGRPRWGEALAFERVVFSYNQQYRLTFTQLLWDYDSHTAEQQISAEDLIIQLLDKKTSGVPANIETLLPEAWLKSLPKLKMNISSVAWQNVHFQSWYLDNNAQTLNVSALLFLPNTAPISTQFQISQNNQVSLELGNNNDEQQLASLKFDISQQDKELFVLANVNWLVSSELGAFFETIGVKHAEGQAQISFRSANQGPVDQVLQNFQVDAEFNSEHITTKGEMFDIHLPLLLRQKGGNVRILSSPKPRSALKWTANPNSNTYSVHLSQGLEVKGKALDVFAGNFLKPAYWHGLKPVKNTGVKVFMEDRRLAEITLLPNSYVTEGSLYQFRINAGVHASALQEMLSPFALDNEKLQFSAGVVLEKEALRLNISALNNLVFSHSDFQKLGIRSANLHVPTQSVDVDLRANMIKKIRANIELKHEELNSPLVGDVSLENFSLQGGNIFINSQAFMLKNMHVGRMLSKVEFNTTQKDTIQASFHTRNACEQSLLRGRWLLSPSSHRVTLSLDKHFSEEDSLRNWLNIQGLPLDIQKGQLSVKIDLDLLDANANNRFDISMNEGAIISDMGVLNGVQLRFSPRHIVLHEGTKAQMRFELEGRVASANIATEVTDIGFRGNIDAGETWTFNVDHFRLPIFGGLVSLKPQSIALAENSEIVLTVENVELTKLVETQQIENLTTTGKLSGVFPIGINEWQLVLEDAQLSNTDGGKINYFSPLKVSSDLNEKLKLTLDVLEDFHYEVLDTDIAYEEGNLLLHSKIKGRNPEVAGGQRVDLNLNTELELLPALEVMRLTSGLQKKLEQKLNKPQSNVQKVLCRR